MSMSEQLEYLCDILIWQNNAICKSISKGKFNELESYKYFKETAREIKNFKKTLSHDSLPAEPPMTREEQQEQYQEEEYDKLVTRFEKIKQKRQQEIENDKKWSKMNNENDEIISRLNRLKPVEPVVEPDPDIEYFDKMDELERERDEYFQEKDCFDRMDELERQRDKYFEEKDRRERAKYLDKRAKIKKRQNK